MPCDYGSRHANTIDHLSQKEQAKLGFDLGNEIYVRKIINLNGSPDVLTTENIQNSARVDHNYQHLLDTIKMGDRTPPKDCGINQKIFQELTVVDGLILRGDKILLPNTSEKPGDINIRTKILDIAHEGHPGKMP